MLKTLLIVYGLGAVITTAALLRPQETRHGGLINVASILLWPLYWAYFLCLLFLARDRS